MDDDNPCIGICIIGEDGCCEGCGRSEDEIYGAPTRAVDEPIASLSGRQAV